MDWLNTITWGELVIVCVQVFGLGFGILLMFDTLMGIGALLAVAWSELGQDRHA